MLLGCSWVGFGWRIGDRGEVSVRARILGAGSALVIGSGFPGVLDDRAAVVVAIAESRAVGYLRAAGSGWLVRLHCLGDVPYMRLNSRLNCDGLV